MPKGYWVVCYREITDPAKVAAYGMLAVPAIDAAGGRILTRGNAVFAFESGQLERTVIVEFASVERAAACHESAAYQAALKALEGGAVRDLRIVPGL